MGWSTRQLAELAGTTVRAVRHYHEVGLLAEPERRANGYKSYGVAHLVRVLRIKRLTGLGLSLAQVAELGDADEHPEQTPRELDSELAATIERLQRTRRELAVILRQTEALQAHELDPVFAEFDHLPADAHEQTRQDLAERLYLTPQARKMFTEFPSARDMCAGAPRGEDFALCAIAQAIHELYNPAQIDVLIRMNR
ncbi:MerR family transcriptional regulator [Kutzneria viridogrisea]|uniref:HTH merR-type domain-containing protein n=2 Tax=Kutzneria TaxID=43356 RepID=W5WVJ0_9PSEU|nr:MerR family transcriptional regulator [Kutzneria albida]AHI02135.1 hypothetical protein KALB_8778 [Kutzneria albida DSM 43870]MBA8929302.1 DNA-binding transcriptional MerR regulator [Kutzneria viridogrisea]